MRFFAFICAVAVACGQFLAKGEKNDDPCTLDLSCYDECMSLIHSRYLCLQDCCAYGAEKQ